ncbi:MAG: hypothetical protein JO293_04880 [Candidatus Eremiobacteraeota bacterium]|nr:hypothetical protein [Candidatus Eremiobacteraeota bacterium]
MKQLVGATWLRALGCAALYAFAMSAAAQADQQPVTATPAASASPLEQPSPAASPAQLVPASPSQTTPALQYVQVQHASTLTMPGIPGAPGFKLPAYFQQQIQQELEGQLSSRLHDFLTGVLRGALTRASPLIGFLANEVASKLEDKLLSKVLPDPNMPIVKMKDVSISSTTTLSADRTRVDYAHISIIAQCDTGKMITLEHDKKTYFVTTLDANNAYIQSATSGGAGSMQIHIETVPDAQTETIAGLVAHHEVETLTASGIHVPKVTQDRWYAVSDMANACGGNGQRTNGNVEIPLRSVNKIDPKDLPITLPSMPGLDLNKLLSTQIETTSVKQITCAPQFFDVPPDYTQVEAPAQLR